MEYTPRQQSIVARRSTGTVFSCMREAAHTERTKGRQAKAHLKDQLFELIDSTDYYQGSSQDEDTELLTNKLLRFRPRLIGAVGVYNYLSCRESTTTDTQSLENFYLFWALGSIQDDFIDTLPKYRPGETSEHRRQCDVAQAIFGDERRFYRAAYHQLRENIHASNAGKPEQAYMIDKVTGWYQFLINQEAAVLETPLDDMTFESCKTYREDQNLQAGSALVALLNGPNCLNPTHQEIEPIVAEFSFLTQIMDDIADTAEDLTAERPSYAVGALLDHPSEMAAVRAYIAAHPNAKLTPHRLNTLAPGSLHIITETFNGYLNHLYEQTGSKTLTSIASGLFHYYPYIRNVLYCINPKYANF